MARIATAKQDDHLQCQRAYPAQAEADLEEDDGDDSHQDADRDDDAAPDPHELSARGLGVDVGLIDVVGDQGGDGDLLRGTSGGDSHEEHDEDEVGAAVAHHVDGDCRGHETCMTAAQVSS